MAYTKQTFTSGQILKASDLNTMSQGIVDKQDKLVSGTNLKTINGQSLLGSGDIAIEDGSATESKVVDLVMFMGQSNMAGRGVASEAPVVPDGQGYEFRAISNPTKLYNIVEPFGVNENNSASGVTETTKTGSMVSAFAIEYYKRTGVPIVGVSCSKGGTEIAWWAVDTKPLTDAVERHNLAKTWLEENGYTIRHDYMVWCQGESDARLETSKETYNSSLKSIIETMAENGVEKCFVVRVGNHRDDPTYYDSIMEAQTELCQTYDDAIMASTLLAGFAEQGLMKDEFHFLQEGYNIVGTDAGKNTAFFANTGIEPYMYDAESKSLYFPYGGMSVGNTIAVDSALDSASENPVQNKVVTAEIEALNELVNSIGSGTTTKFTVTYDLTNVTSSSRLATVYEGRVYTTTLTPTKSYVIKSVSVTMGDEDVTADVYADGVINIEGVSGNIVITAVAEEFNLEFTNLEFTFDSAEENGINLTSVGTVSNGVLALSPANNTQGGTSRYIELVDPVTLSPDESFTIEIVAQATGQRGVIMSNGDSTVGGFLSIPSLGTGTFRFRDANKTMSVEFKATTSGAKHHYAVVYDSYDKLFTGYVDGAVATTSYSVGSVNTFKAFDIKRLFGGYKNSDTPLDFEGNVYYIRIVKRVLTVSEFHIEE